MPNQCTYLKGEGNLPVLASSNSSILKKYTYKEAFIKWNDKSWNLDFTHFLTKLKVAIDY